VTIRIAIIGFGKIARDQHMPAIAADPRFELAAVATRTGDPQIGVPWFAEAPELLAAMSGKIDAVVIATPPGPRFAIARAALKEGVAVLLEKPPAATLGEIDALVRLAEERGVCLYAGWHSQHAPAVAHAAELLRDSSITSLHINWHEDVRKWHPGQEWVWEPSGFGVFDPGINALSIATAILPAPLFVQAARLQVPEGRQTAIAARLTFAGGEHWADFDWRYQDGEEWNIAIVTDDGRRIDLRDGGARLLVNDKEVPAGTLGEYPSIYARFADCVAAGRVEVDREPLRIVADAMLVARRETVAPFAWSAS
jgi:D-galactose 1-dehydrogenase